MIINIRGTSGSGKSTIVRSLFEGQERVPIYGLLGPKRPEAYALNFADGIGKVYVLGPYETNTGGCDNVRPYERILLLLDKYAPLGHLIFEGLLISDNYGRVGCWLEHHVPNVAVLFMDTPLDACFRNLRQRTAEPGMQHTESKLKAIARVRAKMLQENKLRVADVSMENGPIIVKQLLLQGAV